MEIVYCDGCGERIPTEDLKAGRFVREGEERYCLNCRKVASREAAPEEPETTAAPERPVSAREETPLRRRIAVALGGAAGVAAALATYFIAFGGGYEGARSFGPSVVELRAPEAPAVLELPPALEETGPDLPPEEPSRRQDVAGLPEKKPAEKAPGPAARQPPVDEESKKLLNKVVEYAGKNPDDYEGVCSRFEDLLAKPPILFALHDQAKSAYEQYKHAYDARAKEAAAQARARAAQLEKEEKLDEAARTLEETAARLQSPPARETAAELTKEAELFRKKAAQLAQKRTEERNERMKRALLRSRRMNLVRKLFATVATRVTNMQFDRAVEACDGGEFSKVSDRAERMKGHVRLMEGLWKKAAEGAGAFKGMRVELKLRGGKLKGVLKDVGRGHLKLDMGAGGTSVKLSRLDRGEIRRFASGRFEGGRAEEEHAFALLSLYARDLDGARAGLEKVHAAKRETPLADELFEMFVWEKREKEARGAFGELLKLREKKEWVSLIARALEVRREYADTYAVGIGRETELKKLVREAVLKKKVTVVLQHGVSPGKEYAGVADTTISGWKARHNLGACDHVRTWPGQRVILIRFDLSPLPRDVVVCRAEMALYCHDISYPSPPMELAVYRVTSPWVEGKGPCWSPNDHRAKGGATWECSDYPGKKWKSAGGDVGISVDYGAGFPGRVVSSAVAKGKWVRFVVTPVVGAWTLQKYPNDGFLIRNAGPKGGGGFNFHSRDHKKADLRPKLTVVYEGTLDGKALELPPEVMEMIESPGVGD